ncbi:hypothetical protein F4777DRAFT_488244 [Nemania sp. FL0916]|nr:hypothetical protein F4777DRAFT_488244 [Nemania sp. FL0916]
MAEVISIVGSSIALFQLASRMSSCILALRGLLTKVKDVSSKISAMMKEVEVLDSIVEVIKMEFNGHDHSGLTSWNDATIHLIIDYCERTLEDLNTVLQELMHELDTSKKLQKYKATVRVIMKKDVLDRCHVRLQSAVRSLGLTQQWYIIALLKAQPTLIVEHMAHRRIVYESEKRMSPPMKPISGVPRRPPKRQQSKGQVLTDQLARIELRVPSYANCWKFGPLGSIAWRYYWDERQRNSGNFTFIARILANSWFASRIWDIQASRAAAGWTVKLNAYCIQPESAEVFCCARNGDISGILQLVNLGKASLQDHAPNGQSLLHFAAEYGHLDLVRALAESGLDLLEFDDGLSQSTTGKARPRARPVELLVVRRGIDATALHQFYLDNDSYTVGSLFLHPTEKALFYECVAAASPGIIDTVLQIVLPRFYERLELEDRMKYCPFDDPGADPDVFRVMVNPDCCIRQDDISSLQRNRICLLSLLAFRYGPMAMRGSLRQARQWRELVREVIPLTEDLSFHDMDLDPTFQSTMFHNSGVQANPVWEFLQRNQPLTPLFTALVYFRYESQEFQTPTCSRDLRKRTQIALTWWLEDLAACQVDLLEYGRVEKRLFRRNEKLRQAWYYCGRTAEREQNSQDHTLDEMAHLVDFDYGANPRDWQLHWDTESERHVGEFWNSIETLSLH